jgi:hypothetical protein
VSFSAQTDEITLAKVRHEVSDMTTIFDRDCEGRPIMHRTIIRGLATTILIILPLTATGWAQSSHISAKIPFDFRVGQTIMPAGEYVLQTVGSGVHRIRSSDDGHSFALFSTFPMYVPGGSKKAQLVFNRYGNDYFLSKIWWAVGEGGSQVRQDKLEKEIAKTASAPHVTALAANPVH